MKTKSSKRSAALGANPRVSSAVVRGVLVGAGVCAVFLVCCACLISAVDLPHMAIELMASLCIVLSSVGAGFSAARAAREQGMLLGGCCGACLFGILLLCSLSISPSIGLAAVFKLAMAVLGGCLGGVWGVNKRSAPKKRK